MKLHYREYGHYTGERPTLLLLHGLLGSSSNWHSIARRLEGAHHILVPDLRNHGRSPHAQRMDYPSLAGDLRELIDDQGLDTVIPVGHSMGGKVAMWLALFHPALVQALVVVDIAPVRYPNRFAPVYQALEGVDLTRVQNRREADRALARWLPEEGLRQYLLQSLVKGGSGWYWRFNLQALSEGMEAILDFPGEERVYPGPCLFIYGTASDYVTTDTQPAIRRQFPLARLRPVAGAGHWLYTEQPEAFLSALSRFLDAQS
ncbi:MAG TPA: alpha/beta fold hydrolase [Sedimenticola sp.]|nr:alpha/beta fold hydrolase [Sedimenticola sp.]